MGKTIYFHFDGTGNEPKDSKDKWEDRQLINENISNIAKLHIYLGGSFQERPTHLQDGNISFYYKGIATYTNAFSGFIKKVISWINYNFAPEFMDVKDILKRAMDDFKNTYVHGGDYDRIVITGFSRGAALGRRFASLINEHVDSNIVYECMFDTVASLNFPDFSKNNRPKAEVVFEHGHQLPSNVNKALHLVSLDEKRRVFQPTLMNHDPNILWIEV